MMMSLTGCLTTKVVGDSAAVLHYVRVEDTSCLSRDEKEDLAFNKCLIYKAKYGKHSDTCKEMLQN